MVADETFWGCSRLTSVTLLGNVKTIGASAFRFCGGLTGFSIPGTVTSIGASAFDSCASLTSLTIPAGVTTIGDFAFRVCSALTTLTANPATPPTVGANTFYSVSGSLKVYVPAGSVASYQAAPVWSVLTIQSQ